MNSNKVPRYILILLLSVIIAVRLRALTGRIITHLSGLEIEALAYSITFLDIFLFLGITSILFSVFVIVVSSHKRLLNKLGSHLGLNIFICFLLSLGTASFFIAAPLLGTVLFYNGTIQDNTPWISTLLSETYLTACVITGFTIGLSIFDLTLKGKSIRLLNLIFLLTPTSFFNLFPLMWWNTVSTVTPSFAWKLWRPFLTIATCLLPLFSFPSNQIIHKKLSDIQRGPIEIISNKVAECDGYFMEWAPEKPDFYFRCMNSFYHAKAIGLTVTSVKSFDRIPAFDEASIDHKQGIAYIYSSREKLIYMIRIPQLDLVSTFPMPYNKFPILLEGVRQVLDEKKEHLFIMGLYGNLVKVGIGDDNFGSYNHSKLPAPIYEIRYDNNHNRLFILSKKVLYILNSEDLSILKEIPFEHIALGMNFDYENGRYFVSFPSLMEIRVFDLKTHKLLDKIPAPMGARKIAIDPENEVLFVGSMSGVIEIRSLEDFSLKTRERVTPWIHWLDVSPSQKKLLVSVNINQPFIYSYQEYNITSHLLDLFQRLIEAAARIGFATYESYRMHVDSHDKEFQNAHISGQSDSPMAISKTRLADKSQR